MIPSLEMEDGKQPVTGCLRRLILSIRNFLPLSLLHFHFEDSLTIMRDILNVNLLRIKMSDHHEGEKSSGN